jgi:hypothetical protein
LAIVAGLRGAGIPDVSGKVGSRINLSTLLAGALLASAANACFPTVARAEIAVDGQLTEAEWADAQVFTDFRVTQPYTLGTPRHPTEVRLVGTPQGIAVGFRCTHPSSTPRIKEQTPRDIDNNGDRVNIFIDLDADAQVAYNMTFALAGSLQDATITNETVYSTDWDGDYLYAIRDTGEEWFVEVLLPWTLASMKNTGTPRRTIAIAFDRVVGVIQEPSALQGVSFSRPRYLSEFPHVEIDQHRGSLLHVFPYATAAGDWVNDETDLKFGADILWKPSGNFQLTAALNPDFGQVEADELVVNFDAIEVLFSDRRPFFAENQALFDVRVAAEDRLIYTRRIGGARDDDPTRAAEIDGALKINTSLGRLELGLLSAVEREYGDDLGRAFAAQRVRYNEGDWTVGYLGTWTDRPFFDRRAIVHSSDFIWRPGEQFALQGQALASSVDEASEEASGDGGVLSATYTPSADWQHQAVLTHFSQSLDFNDLGFQERTSLNRAAFSFSRRFRDFPGDDARAAVTWRFQPATWWNDTGEHLHDFYDLVREAQHRSGAVFTSRAAFSTAGVDDLISRGNGNVNLGSWIEAVGQAWQSARLGKWRLFGELLLFQEGEEGYAWEAEAKVEHFARDDLSTSLAVEAIWSDDWLIWMRENLLAGFNKRQALIAADLNWFPAPSHELRVKLQWLGIDAWDATPYRIASGGDLAESSDLVEDFRVNNVGLQIRYRWTFAPQSDFYIVYGRGGLEFQEGPRQRGLDGMIGNAIDLRDSDQLIVKARYRF